MYQPSSFPPVFDGSRFKSIIKVRKWRRSFGWQRKRQSGGETHENAGAGPFQCTRANSDFQLRQIHSAKSFPLLKRQTLIFLGHFLKKVNLNKRNYPSSPIAAGGRQFFLCVRLLFAIWVELWAQPEASLRSKTVTPTPPPSIQQSFLAALKVKPKRQKKQQWCTEESSHRELFVNAACFSSSKKRQGKGVGKAGSQGSGDKREEEEKSCKRTSWAVFLFISLVCARVMCRCTLMSTSAFWACMFMCVCEYIQVFLHVCRDVHWCACLQQVDTAVVQQVGGALCSLLQQLVLVDDLHRLVVNAQPAVEPNVEDIRGVMTACRTVPMVIHNWLSWETGQKKSRGFVINPSLIQMSALQFFFFI